MTPYEQGCLAAQILCGFEKEAAAHASPKTTQRLLKFLHDALDSRHGDYFIRVPIQSGLGATGGALTASAIDSKKKKPRVLAGAAAGALGGATITSIPHIKDALKALLKKGIH